MQQKYRLRKMLQIYKNKYRNTLLALQGPATDKILIKDYITGSWVGQGSMGGQTPIARSAVNINRRTGERERLGVGYENRTQH